MKRILVPLDGSAFAEKAIDTARALAARTGAALELITVLEPFVPPSRVSGTRPLDPRLDIELRGAQAKYFERLERAERQRGTVAVTGVVREGRPPDEIADYASTQDADLIVMTTHGRGGFERFWLGSVADGVIRAASMPVLLVRESSGAEAGGGVALNRVVVALAGAPHDDTIIEAVLKVTDPMRSTYTLVHVPIPSPLIGAFDLSAGPAPDATAGVPGHGRIGSDAEGYLDLMARRFREHTTSVEARVTQTGGAGREIVDLARQTGANLIATGTAARAPLARAFMGSVADKVVRSSECSVLVVPQTQRVSEFEASAVGHSVSERY